MPSRSDTIREDGSPWWFRCGGVGRGKSKAGVFRSTPQLAVLCALAILLRAKVAHAQDSLPVLVGMVTKIVNGETIDVQLTSGPICVRLHGVGTPERDQPWRANARK